EKQTDVNIALHMYRDCVQGSYDHVVLVSNDSDLAPAIQLVRNDFPNIICGVVIPSSTRKSRSLTQIAHWSRDGITENELEQSQLPQTIEYKTSSKTKQLHKPKGW
ncbi:MAG: NYN domain-containing protein, partial [Gammaproteobacteria bacterium]